MREPLRTIVCHFDQATFAELEIIARDCEMSLAEVVRVQVMIAFEDVPPEPIIGPTFDGPLPPEIAARFAHVEITDPENAPATPRQDAVPATVR